MVTFRRVSEVEMGRCLVMDVSVRGQNLRLINIYGPQSERERKRLFTEIKPFLFTAQEVVFGDVPPKGKGIWRLNSLLLEEESVRQSFRDFFQAQVTLLDCCSSRSEWWEMVKRRAVGLFKNIAKKRAFGKYVTYQRLRRKLEIAVSGDGDPGEIKRIKDLLRKSQYDRHASLLLERDYGKSHSPDPYQNCKQSVAVKVVYGLKDSTGSLVQSRAGILEIVRSFYAELLGSRPLDETEMESFLCDIPGLVNLDVPLAFLTERISAEEVAKAIEQLAIKKTPGPDGLTAEFYKVFKDILAPELAEVYNRSLAEDELPPSMRESAVILLSKGKDSSRIENWRPISLLNVDRKILAKIIFWRLSQVANEVVAYADDVTVVVSGQEEAEGVCAEIARYSLASGSKINQDKCEIFWMGKENESFLLPVSFPAPKEKIKVLGIEFGPGDYGHQNWESRLKCAEAKVVRWKAEAHMASKELTAILKEQGRPKWDNKVQYLLTCIGFAVGLGNVWRFPYLCQTYGGGAFLIPYGIALVLQGIPLFHLELAVGQRLRRGSIGAWNTVSPYLGGIGIASLLVSFLVGIYYNTIIAWILWYFFNSFQNPLPWSFCPTGFNDTGDFEECAKSSTVNYFWYRKTLNITSNINENGNLQWWMVISLATAWGAVYLCTIKGIKSTGKAVYVTSTFPYIVLTIFLIRGITLPGAIDGLKYLFTPDIQILLDPQVWLAAATQIFFSLSLGFGGLIAFSSYNPEKNDCEKDAVTIAVINSMSSLYASIPIFSILGFKAKNAYWDCLDRNIVSLLDEFDISESNLTRDNYSMEFNSLNSTYPERIRDLNLKECNLQHFLDQSASGPGLAFIVFTEAIIQMPGSQAWAILFFIMLFSLGLSSMFGNIEGVLTPVLDLNIFPKSVPVEAVSGLICLISFAASVIFTMGSGNYWLQIFDEFTGSLTLLIVVFFEVTAVTFVYGIER
ncbi:sodium-dependent neutral amino acid transporter B(0)AT3-like [Hyperolius riggenbachi]|uniref:sodium-dependent neutral amino acid transporter B(0)AT3-like n=1 Tax=Hyperolius riggenbachi TaxID=752182 RepID=UPI0035A3CC6F